MKKIWFTFTYPHEQPNCSVVSAIKLLSFLILSSNKYNTCFLTLKHTIIRIDKYDLLLKITPISQAKMDILKQGNTLQSLNQFSNFQRRARRAETYNSYAHTISPIYINLQGCNINQDRKSHLLIQTHTQ